MNKIIERGEPYAYPPKVQEIFNLLKKAGAEHFALFGGAIRDADYVARAVRRKGTVQINDYDIRVWFPPQALASVTGQFLENLENMTGSLIAAERSKSSRPRPHYRMYLDFNDLSHPIDLDITIRPVPDMYLGGHIDVSAVAVDRVRDSDLGISAVAIDSAGGAWATSEYELDQERGQITVYPVTDNARVSSYLERISKKFPRNRIVEWAPPASPGGMPFSPK